MPYFKKISTIFKHFKLIFGISLNFFLLGENFRSNKNIFNHFVCKFKNLFKKGYKQTLLVIIFLFNKLRIVIK